MGVWQGWARSRHSPFWVRWGEMASAGMQILLGDMNAIKVPRIGPNAQARGDRIGRTRPRRDGDGWRIGRCNGTAPRCRSEVLGYRAEPPTRKKRLQTSGSAPRSDALSALTNLGYFPRRLRLGLPVETRRGGTLRTRLILAASLYAPPRHIGRAGTRKGLKQHAQPDSYLTRTPARDLYVPLRPLKVWTEFIVAEAAGKPGVSLSVCAPAWPEANGSHVVPRARRGAGKTPWPKSWARELGLSAFAMTRPCALAKRGDLAAILNNLGAAMCCSSTRDSRLNPAVEGGAISRLGRSFRLDLVIGRRTAAARCGDRIAALHSGPVPHNGWAF